MALDPNSLALSPPFEEKPHRILIVDDQIFNINALKTIIQHKFGVDPGICDHCLNGEEAYAQIKKDYASRLKLEKCFSYTLILMDCNMPFMDGFECTKKIRNFYFKKRGLGVKQQPIISAVTGHAEPKYINKCFDYGMNQVLSKPID